MSQSTARWYVVQTQPHAEGRADEHLRRQGFVTYMPKLLKQRRHARKTETVSRPLFPRYMFVLIDHTHQGWHAIRSTFGVSSLVGGENGPLAVREGIVEALRAQEGADGYFRAAARRFAAGTPVRVVDGIFASAIGLFESMSDKDRVAVLLDFLGRRVRVVLEADSIAAVWTTARCRFPRHARGKRFTRACGSMEFRKPRDERPYKNPSRHNAPAYERYL